MKKNFIISNTISIISQRQKQKQILLKLYIKNIKQINLMNFLWINSIIYGYTKKNNILLVYLKYNKLSCCMNFIKINKNNNIITLKKNKNWNKNSFLIIKTNKGFTNIKNSIEKKIGGFVLYSLF